MNKYEQQLNRVLAFVEAHGNTSDKLAAAEVREAARAQQAGSGEAVAWIDLVMIFQDGLSSCFDGRDVQRLLTGEQFLNAGINPNAVDGTAKKGEAVMQAKNEIARAAYPHPQPAQQGSVPDGRSKKWLKTLDRWIDLMIRLEKQPVHTSIRGEVARMRVEVQRYREHKVRPRVESATPQPADNWKPANNMSGDLPQIGRPVMGYHQGWVDEDFCADGIRECFLFGDGSEWQSARWDGYSDQWIVEDGAPELWHPHPNPPAEGAE